MPRPVARIGTPPNRSREPAVPLPSIVQLVTKF
jgi:hypothetical protein